MNPADIIKNAVLHAHATKLYEVSILMHVSCTVHMMQYNGVFDGNVAGGGCRCRTASRTKRECWTHAW
jgi:hypothetical protein